MGPAYCITALYPLVLVCNSHIMIFFTHLQVVTFIMSSLNLIGLYQCQSSLSLLTTISLSSVTESYLITIIKDHYFRFPWKISRRTVISSRSMLRDKHDISMLPGSSFSTSAKRPFLVSPISGVGSSFSSCMSSLVSVHPPTMDVILRSMSPDCKESLSGNPQLRPSPAWDRSTHDLLVWSWILLVGFFVIKGPGAK